MPPSIPSLIKDVSLEKEWLGATSDAPFIKSLSTSSLPSKNFDNWLIQVRYFVTVERLTTGITFRESTPEDLPKIRFLIEEGYKSLLQERELFQSNAANRQITLPLTTSPSPSPDEETDNESFTSLKQHCHPWCYEYAAWMISCTTKKDISFPNLLFLLWGIEKCYFEAFSYVKHSQAYNTPEFDQGYKKFVEWWTSEEFEGYIDELEGAFNGLVSGKEEIWNKEQARKVMKDMLEHEAKFWASAAT